MISKIFIKRVGSHKLVNKKTTFLVSSKEGKQQIKENYFREVVTERKPFEYDYASYLRAVYCKPCCREKLSQKNKLQMFYSARNQLREEFDAIELVKHIRKLNLIKLVIMRQY